MGEKIKGRLLLVIKLMSPTPIAKKLSIEKYLVKSGKEMGIYSLCLRLTFKAKAEVLSSEM